MYGNIHLKADNIGAYESNEFALADEEKESILDSYNIEEDDLNIIVDASKLFDSYADREEHLELLEQVVQCWSIRPNGINEFSRYRTLGSTFDAVYTEHLNTRMDPSSKQRLDIIVRCLEFNK